MTTPEEEMKAELHAERRRNDAMVLKIVGSIQDEVASLRRELSDHIKGEPESIASAVAAGVAGVLRDAFPDGDAGGHRKAHEAQIEAINTRTQLLKELTKELVKWGLFGVLGWLVYVVWHAFLQGPKA